MSKRKILSLEQRHQIYIKNMMDVVLIVDAENDKIKVTKKGKIKTTKIGYFFDCKKIRTTIIILMEETKHLKKVLNLHKCQGIV